MFQRQGWMRLVVPVVVGVTLGLLAVSLVLTIGRGIYVIQDVLWPLAMALLIAYVFDPLVTWLNKAWHWPRVLSTSILFFISLSAVALLLVWLIPMLVEQIRQLGGSAQSIGRSVADWLASHPALMKVLQPTTAPADGSQIYSEIVASLQTLTRGWANLAQTGVEQAWQGLNKLFNALTLLILMPTYTFVFLWRFDALKRWATGWLPAEHRPRIRQIVGKIDLAVSAFFRGRLIICLIVGALTAMSWSVVGLRFGLLLGVIVGILNLVPFLAILIGLPIAMAVAVLLPEPGTSVGALLLLTVIPFSIIQALDGFVLTPTIQGKAVGLHPVTIIVVLLIGSSLMGILGLLLAVPAAAALKIVGQEWWGPWLRAVIHAAPAKPSGHSRAQRSAGEGP